MVAQLNIYILENENVFSFANDDSISALDASNLKTEYYLAHVFSFSGTLKTSEIGNQILERNYIEITNAQKTRLVENQLI